MTVIPIYLALRFRSLLWVGAAVAAVLALAPCVAVAQVTQTTGVINNLTCDIWTWTDASGMPRTVAFNSGYAIQMTYYVANFEPFGGHQGHWQRVTVNADNSQAGGGFGYFVSHERYRYFDDGSVDTIAHKIFATDDSPLGASFPATSQTATALDGNSASESFTITYSHYGTTTPFGYDPNSGQDSPLLPSNAPSSYAQYNLPVTTTWTFQSGRDFPRIDVSVSLAQVPQLGLVSFDVRGPYGAMIFADNAYGTVSSAQWGDGEMIFTPAQSPIVRGSGWSWNTANNGARYNLLTIGGLPGIRYEMGLFEPVPASQSALVDGYAAERGSTSGTFPSSPDYQPSTDQCGDFQALPSDGNWPYQSVQYSLPCAGQAANYLTTPTNYEKIAWGSSSLYGFYSGQVYNGYSSVALNALPPNLNYSVCLVVGRTKWPPFGGRVKYAPPIPPLTVANAALYTAANPSPANSDCATATLPLGFRRIPPFPFPFPLFRSPLLP
jgi:hypothetical protein